MLTPNHCVFSDIAAGVSRSKASQLFFDLLCLVSEGTVDVEQNEPYGDIEVRVV